MTVTVVTALYDIGREKLGDGRAFAKYLDWFSSTLKLNVPMVVFVHASLRDFVLESRPSTYQTVIICQPFHDCPTYKYIDEMRAVLQGTFSQHITSTSDLAMRLPEYLVVIYAKFAWLKRAMIENPFSSSVFIWMDAGVGRFWPTSFKTNLSWPDPQWSKQLQLSTRVWLQGRPSLLPYLEEKRQYQDNQFIGTCEALIWSTIFGGKREAVQKVCDLALQCLTDSMLKRNRIDTEQVALQMVWNRNRDLFRFIIPKRSLWNLFGTMLWPQLVQLWGKREMHEHFMWPDLTPQLAHGALEERRRETKPK